MLNSIDVQHLNNFLSDFHSEIIEQIFLNYIERIVASVCKVLKLSLQHTRNVKQKC